LTRWDVEGMIIKLTMKHGFFDEWDHDTFHKLYDLFEEDEIEESADGKPGGGLDKDELTKFIIRLGDF